MPRNVTKYKKSATNDRSQFFAKGENDPRRAPSPLAEDEDTTRSIPASPRTSALRGDDGHGTCSCVFFAAASATSPVRSLQRMSTAFNWANTLLGARRSRQDSWQEEVVADRSYRVRKGRAVSAHLCLGPRVCLCAREWLVAHSSLPPDARLHDLRPQW